MGVTRLETAQLAEISTGDAGQRRALSARANIYTTIAEGDRSIGRNLGESVEDVSEVFRRQIRDRRALGAYSPRCEIADDAHRWCAGARILAADGASQNESAQNDHEISN